jgi:hypothetical protein
MAYSHRIHFTIFIALFMWVMGFETHYPSFINKAININKGNHMIWKNVNGYESRYQININGQVKSLLYCRGKKGRMLKPIKRNDGYLEVGLMKNGKCNKVLIHRIVIMAFGDNNHLKDVHHINGNKEIFYELLATTQ